MEDTKVSLLKETCEYHFPYPAEIDDVVIATKRNNYSPFFLWKWVIGRQLLRTMIFALSGAVVDRSILGEEDTKPRSINE